MYPLELSISRPISSIIIFFKKCIRRLIRFCLEPICYHQTLFNNYAASMLQKINSDLQKMRYQQKAHTDELQHLKAAVHHASLQQVMQSDHTLNQMDIQMKWVSETFQAQADLLESNKADLHAMELQLSIALQKVSVMEDTIAQLDTDGLCRSSTDGGLTFAQSGEDSIIYYILKAKGIPAERATYLDLGANHAKEISNTYALYCAGARGVLLEANPALIPELRLYRSEDIIVNKCLYSGNHAGETLTFYVMNGDGLSTCDKNSAEEAIRENPTLEIIREVPVAGITMKEIIETYFSTPPCLVNLDVEGMEMEVMNSIDFESWRPLIFIIETIPYRPRLIIEEKREDIVNYMQAHDYAEYAFTGINSIFIDKRQMR